MLFLKCLSFIGSVCFLPLLLYFLFWAHSYTFFNVFLYFPCVLSAFVLFPSLLSLYFYFLTLLGRIPLHLVKARLKESLLP